MKNVSLVNDEAAALVQPIKTVMERAFKEKPTFTGNQQWKKITAN